MFWNKKDDKKSLPDLPQIKSPFSRELAISSDKAKIVEDKMEETEQEAEDDMQDNEKHALPAFPDSASEKGFSQSAIKEAVSQEELKEPEEKISAPEESKSKKFKTIEMDEEHASSNDENPYLTSKKFNSENKKSYAQQITPYNAPYNPEKSMDIGLPPSEMEMDDDSERPSKAPAGQKGDIFVKIEKFYSAKKSLDAIKQQIDQIDELLRKIREIKLKEERELAVWEKEIALVKSRIQNVNETIFEKISQ